MTANTKAPTPAESGSPARPVVKSCRQARVTTFIAGYVSPLIVKRTVPPEERRRKRHRARRDEPQYTVSKRRYRERTPSPARRGAPPRLSPKQRKRSHSPPPARWPKRGAHTTPPLGTSPTKAFSFGQMAVVTPTQRCLNKDPLPTPPQPPLPTATVTKPPAVECGEKPAETTPAAALAANRPSATSPVSRLP